MNNSIKYMLLCIGLFCIAGCQRAIEPTGEEMVQSNNTLFLQIGNEEIEISVTNQEISQQIMEYLPQTLNFNELNGNEFYVDSPFEVDAKSQNFGEVRAGDVMLYGNQTIVIFYQDHQTTYSYSKIGKIRDVSHLNSLVNCQDAILRSK